MQVLAEGETMFCTKCGAELADGARFCTKCGAALATDGSAVQESAPALDGAVAGDAAPVDAAGTAAGEPAAPADAAAAEPPAAAGEPTAVAGEPTAAAGTKLADAPDATPASAKKKVRKPLLIAACVALVLVAGVGGAIALRGGGSAVPAALELVYGSNDVSAVARSARLVPLDGDGEPIAHYWIRFRRAVDADGEEIDLTDVEAFEVAGTDGFVIGDVLADLPDGTYYPVISDEEDGEDRPLPPVNVGDGEDANGGTITIKPDDEQKLGADALFLAKLETLQAQYGGPAIGVKKLAESDMYFSMLEGLSYADLLDFGDGTERLALAYRADWLLDGWTVQGDWAHAYIFEIWEYDEDADSISKIPSYDGNPMEVSTRGWQGFSEVLSPVRQVESGNQYVAIEVEESSSVDSRALADADYVPRAMSGKAYYGLNEGGVFGHLVTLESNEGPGEPNPIYQIDGKVVSETEYAKAAAPFSMSEASDEVAPAFSRASDQVTEEQAQAGDVSSLAGGGTPADTKQQTLDTIEELRSRVEASARKDGDAAEAKDDADTEKSAAAQTVRAQAKTVDEAVTVPNYGRDLANPSDELVEWTYVSFDPADASDGVAKINAALKESFEAEKKATASWNTDDPGDGECVYYRSGCTYNDGAYAAVRIERRCTNWGPHGWAEIDGFVFDLKTGAEVSPWEVAGVSQAELEEVAVDAIVTYVQGHPGSDLSGADEIAAAARDEIAEGYATFLLTDKGVTVYLQDYSMGYAYADGDKEILVLPFDGGGAAGDNVRDAYSLMESELMA